MTQDDLIKLDHLADIGMSEMIHLMRLHVQEVTRFTTLIAVDLNITAEQALEFHNECQAYNIDSTLFIHKSNKLINFTPTGIYFLKICAKVHDIGKPFFRHLYSQSRKLTEQEFDLQKLHANFSRVIVKSWINDRTNGLEHSNLVHFVADSAAAHQEKYDGTGYPDNLEGTSILFTGRLLAVADAISAMINHRPYHEPMSLKECIERLETGKGSHFDPEICQQVINILQKDHHNEARITGHWAQLQDYSDAYIRFVKSIDFDEINMKPADTARVQEMKEAISVVLGQKQCKPKQHSLSPA